VRDVEHLGDAEVEIPPLRLATKYRRSDKRVFGVVTGWAALPNGDGVTIHETHEQRAWHERELVECLNAARLEVVEIIDFDPFQELASLEVEEVKLFFVCRGAL